MIVIDHGIEYAIEFDPTFDFYPALARYIENFKKQVHWDEKGRIVIASTKQTDDRLVISSYYLERQSEWFSTNHVNCEAIDSNEFTLTAAEQVYLDFILKEFGDAVIRHGWYDVVYHR